MIRALTIIVLVGLLFSGYLSGVKLISSTCAFGEQCPYFLGFPACYYGFAMYLAMFLIILTARARLTEERTLYTRVLMIALLGICFAGYFTFREIGTIFTDGFTIYMLGLPTCAWGLLLYILIAFMSWKGRNTSGAPV
jgi:hypothetical protein